MPTVKAMTDLHEGIPVQQRLIGPRSVSAIGLGGMPMSIEGRPDTERSVATIHAALDAGVTLIDTADAYHRDADDVGHNEELIAEALRSYGGDTSHVLVATKGGHLRPGDGSWTLDGRPEHLKAAAKASAQRLGVDAIGLYQFHRPDPKVPYADSVGAIRDLLDEGVIQLAGHLERDRRADRPGQRDPRRTARLRPEPVLADLPVEPGRARPLRRARHRVPALVAARRHRADRRRWAESHPAFQRIADERGVSLQQVILAWELALAPVVIPIPGASRPGQHPRLRPGRRPRPHRRDDLSSLSDAVDLDRHRPGAHMRDRPPRHHRHAGAQRRPRPDADRRARRRHRPHPGRDGPRRRHRLLRPRRRVRRRPARVRAALRRGDAAHARPSASRSPSRPRPASCRRARTSTSPTST